MGRGRNQTIAVAAILGAIAVGAVAWQWRKRALAVRVPERVLSLGSGHLCVIRSDKTVACVGSDGLGQLGDRSLRDVISVAALEISTCAVTKDGRVWCWGSYVGDHEKEAGPAPIRIGSIGDVIEVRGGARHACALRSDATLWCWGSNFNRAVGDDATTDRREPVKVASDVVAFDVSHNHSCAIGRDALVRCWGEAASLVPGASSRLVPAPTVVAGLTGIVGISTNLASACAWRATGSPVCWGWRTHQQPKDATGEIPPTPVEGLGDVTQVAVGGQHTCAIHGGAVWCWGDNQLGQLGDGTKTSRLQPAPVTGLTDVVEIATTYSTTCARTRSGAIMCWGEHYARFCPDAEVCKIDYREYKNGGDTQTKIRCATTPRAITLP